MLRMKVILIKEVDNLGKEGDVVEVKDGFARNYLIPQKLAILANRGNLAQVEQLRKKRAARETKELEQIKSLQSTIEGMVLEFSRKAGETGKLYGSVTSKEIADTLSDRLGTKFDRKYLELSEPIKELGEHSVRINFGQGNYASIKVKVLTEAEKVKEEEQADS